MLAAAPVDRCGIIEALEEINSLERGKLFAKGTAMVVARVQVISRAGERRSHFRRSVDLDAHALRGSEPFTALIQNLSEQGLLIRTDEVVLAAGDLIDISLPEIGNCIAEVVAVHEHAAGCRFLVPISRSAVSAVVLRSPVAADIADAERPDTASSTRLAEFKRSLPSSALIALALSLLFLIVCGLLYLLAALLV